MLLSNNLEAGGIVTGSVGPEPFIVFGATSPQSLKLFGNVPLRMAREGWRVAVICSKGGQAANPWGLEVEIFEISMKRNPALFYDLLSLIRWYRFIGRAVPDIVAAATPKAALLALLVCKIKGVPNRVYLLWGLRLETSRIPVRAFLWLAERLTAALASHIFSVSQSLSRIYLDMNLAPREKLRVIGFGSSHGVDLARFCEIEGGAAPANLPPGGTTARTTLGFVGRFSADKGSRTLVAVAEHLTALEHPFRLLVVGPLENASRDLRKIRKLSGEVIFTGPVDDVRPYFSHIDILLLPTKREGFPNVVLEAASFGIPAVTTSATGAIDAVLHGKTGLVASLGSDPDFCGAVELLLRNPQLRQKLGSNARQMVVDRYSEEKVEASFVEELKSTIKN